MYFSNNQSIMPLDKLFSGKARFPAPVISKYKFEDFQKSEMIIDSSIDGGYHYEIIAIKRHDYYIILKQTITALKNKNHGRTKLELKRIG